MINMTEYEEKLYNEGYSFIGGCDEAGRGPLVGPVVAGCVVFPKGYKNELINDSKKLTEKKREQLYDIIINDALAYGIGIVSSKEIDEINILEASRKAMILAYNEANKKINIDYLLTDAMKISTLNIPVLDIIKGDAKSVTIAAASIIAKVTRDRILYDLDSKYPEYEFRKHKGYPTKRHLELIEKYGVFEEYRTTYKPVKNIIDRGIFKKKG
ncbi:MAG: ribonuclease HII [Bacilli bacterium]|nr:ribonuclease HII [Bacilli bacterium]